VTILESVFVGVDLGGSNLRAALVGPGGEVLARRRGATVDRSPEAVLAAIEAEVGALRADAEALGMMPKALGLGVPGLVRPTDGTVATSPNFPSWADVPLQSELEACLGLAVHVENDVDAIAVGEFEYGAARGCRDVLMIALGTGVGGGLILEGRLRRGPDGTAGEVGHITVRPGGRPCGCGNRGCLEAYASATAITARAVEAGLVGFGEGTERIAELARAGDARARGLFRDAGRCLGITLAGVVNLLNLDRAVVGGGVSRSWDLLRPAVLREIERRAFPLPARRLAVVPAALGDDAGVLGAAWLARRCAAALS
jgi:glucokinase